MLLVKTSTKIYDINRFVCSAGHETVSDMSEPAYSSSPSLITESS